MKWRITRKDAQSIVDAFDKHLPHVMMEVRQKMDPHAYAGKEMWDALIDSMKNGGYR